MDLERLKQPEVAALLLVHERTIRKWHGEEPALPSHGFGKRTYYVWREVLEWRDRKNNAGQEMRKSDDEAPNEQLERARLTKYQADLKEIEVAIRRKETMSLADYEQAMAEMIGPARINLLAIPARLRPSIGDEASRKVDQEIKRALRSLGGEDVD